MQQELEAEAQARTHAVEEGERVSSEVRALEAKLELASEDTDKLKVKRKEATEELQQLRHLFTASHRELQEHSAKHSALVQEHSLLIEHFTKKVPTTLPSISPCYAYAHLFCVFAFVDRVVLYLVYAI